MRRGAPGPSSHATALEGRGFLAGRLIASAIARDALCLEEIEARLGTRRLAGEPWLAARGFLELTPEGATLPILLVRRGRAARDRECEALGFPVAPTVRYSSSMPLPIGTRLGPYEVVAPVGAGGMGEVYRA